MQESGLGHRQRTQLPGCSQESSSSSVLPDTSYLAEDTFVLEKHVSNTNILRRYILQMSHSNLLKYNKLYNK